MMKEEELSSKKIETQTEFDLYRHSYSEQINQSIAFIGQEHDFFTRAKADYLTQIIRDENLHRVLDVGCGHGLIHEHLLSANDMHLFGVDVAPSVLDMAKTNNPNASYQAYDGKTLPFPDASFDMAFAICVMHHVVPEEWLGFLREMKRVIKENGIVLIFEHNPINPITTRIVKKCPLDKNAVLLRSKKLTHLMQEVGFNTIKTHFILFTPFDTSFFKTLDRKLHWLPLGAQYFTWARKRD